MSTRGYPLVAPGLGVNAQVIDAAWRTFTPKISIVGAGVAPNYVTNSGQFMIANNVVRCDIFLDGNGGTPGSGAGQLNIALPALCSPLRPGGFLSPMGYALNNANYYHIAGTLNTGAVWMPLSYWSDATTIATLTGAQQNNATRTIRLHFWYRCDLLY